MICTQGPALSAEQTVTDDMPLDEKFRKACFWIVNNAIIAPYYDIELARLDLDKTDPVLQLDEIFSRGLNGVPEAEIRKLLVAIEPQPTELSKNTRLYAHVQADILTLKYYHQRYSNYLRWLTWR
jgi:hypothetical protein